MPPSSWDAGGRRDAEQATRPREQATAVLPSSWDAGGRRDADGEWDAGGRRDAEQATFVRRVRGKKEIREMMAGRGFLLGI